MSREAIWRTASEEVKTCVRGRQGGKEGGKGWDKFVLMTTVADNNIHDQIKK